MIISKKHLIKGPVKFTKHQNKLSQFFKTSYVTNLFSSPGSDVPVKEQTRGDILNWDTIS